MKVTISNNPVFLDSSNLHRFDDLLLVLLLLIVLALVVVRGRKRFISAAGQLFFVV
jgi:hypothetical protein